MGVEAEVLSWLRARGLEASKPKWYVEIHLDVKEEGASMTNIKGGKKTIRDWLVTL